MTLTITNEENVNHKSEDTSDFLLDEMLEWRYRRRIGAYFGHVLRRVCLVDIDLFEDEIEIRVSRDAFIELLNLDVLAKGNVFALPHRPEIWVAIEISSTINTKDVIRARQCADILCQAGYPAIAVTGGEKCSLEATALAQQTNVVVIQEEGQMTGWDEAFAIIAHMVTE
jgi:hypothetical protein